MTKVNPATTSVQKGPTTGVNGKIWRHTIGRVSNLVRVPINLLASLYIGGKIIAKTVALPVTYSIVGIHHLISKDKSKYDGVMSLRGIGITSVEFAGTIKGASACFTRTITAPGTNDQNTRNFTKGMKATWAAVKGELQREKLRSVSTIFERLILKKTQKHSKT